MATIRKKNDTQKQEISKTVIPSSVYVVVGESYDQMENNEQDVINIRHGILRIFTNKKDVKDYMQKYFEERFPDNAMLHESENKKGFYMSEITMEAKNSIEGAVSFEGSLEGRIYKLRVKAYSVAVTQSAEGLIGDDDLYDALYG